MSTENWQLVSDVFRNVLDTSTNLDFDSLLSSLEPCNEVTTQEGLLSSDGSTLMLKNLTLTVISYYLKLRGILRRDFLPYTGENMRVYATRNVTGPQEGYICRRLAGFCDAIDSKYGQELHLRVLSKGNGRHPDTIEHLYLHMEYGREPLLRLSANGSFCEVELSQRKLELNTSIQELLELVKEMATDLPRVNATNEAIVYIGMRRTYLAPPDYSAPYYPSAAVQLRPVLQYPSETQIIRTVEVLPVVNPPLPIAYVNKEVVEASKAISTTSTNVSNVDDVTRSKVKVHSGVTTGFNRLKSSFGYHQGNFGSSELFIRCYAEAAARARRY